MTTPRVKLPLRQRARKSFAAAGTAFLGALTLALATEVPRTQAGWAAMLGACAGAAFLAGVTTFNTRNRGTDVNGSDPVVVAPTSQPFPRHT